MWKTKKDEGPDPITKQEETPSIPSFENRNVSIIPPKTRPSGGKEVMSSGVIHIGKSVCVKGEITGDEDLTIEGKVEGKIELKNHNLVIGSCAQIRAEIAAKNIQIIGSVVGNVIGSERVEIREVGSLEGDIIAPRVNIMDGAHFKGAVDMAKAPASAEKSFSKTESKISFGAPATTEGTA
ncbi:MAG: polymer-forming cytoskeletal protein [Deltaproteobacteria bacterium]|nr:polymer-forming cytoskeletal protein [Deltaproteobacteria bacterium]